MTSTIQKLSAQEHLFSLFFPHELKKDHDILIKEPLLLQRMLSILRLKKNDSFIFFNEAEYALMNIEQIDEKKQKYINCTITSINRIIPLKPELRLYIGIVKKNNWSEIAYAAAQMGVTELIPVITERSQKEHPEEDRLINIMIAASEQSKQYSLPTIKPAISIDTIPSRAENEFCLFADISGAELNSIIPELSSDKIKSICIGPEAGLTAQDQAVLQSKGFTSIKLTPSILRTIDATALMLGIIRSF